MDHEHDDPELERRLLDRFRAGDAAAFDRIVLLHRLAVYRVARRILGSHEEADEAAQETFLRAYRSLSGFRGDSRLRTWLIRITVNVSRTLGAARERTTGMDEVVDAADDRETAEAAAGRAEAAARVRSAVEALPPRQREVVQLKVFSDMTYDDVASAMGLTAGAVKAHFHQAVSNLRRIMATRTGREEA